MPTTHEQLLNWFAEPEGTRLEFKEAKQNDQFDKRVEYCGALANEGGALVPRPRSTELQHGGAIGMISALARPQHARKPMTFMKFAGSAIATETPPVAISEQVGCKCAHVGPPTTWGAGVST